MRYLICLLALTSPVQAETVYSVYQASTLELQFESPTILTPTPPGTFVMIGSLGITFDHVGAIVDTFGMQTPIITLGGINITSNKIYMNAINFLILDFNSGLPTSPGTYSLVPMNVVDFPNGVTGSYYQAGMQTDLSRFPNYTIPVDTVVVSEHPEPAAWLLMAIGVVLLVVQKAYCGEAVRRW
jgi:hypothetical protein